MIQDAQLSTVRKNLINKKLKPQQKNIIYRDLRNRRWYTLSGQEEPDSLYWKPSVTSILSVLDKPGLTKWIGLHGDYAKILRDAKGFLGSMVHHFCEMLILNEVTSKNGTIWSDQDLLDYANSSKAYRWRLEYSTEQIVFAARMMLTGFYKFLVEKQPVPIAMEQLLYHESVPYAGRADFICMIKDKKGADCRVILDIKTGQENPHFKLQNTAYRTIWNKMYPKEPITHVGNVYLKADWRLETATYRVKITTPDEEGLRSVYDTWKWANTSARGKPPAPQFASSPLSEFKRIGYLDNLNKQGDTANG